MSSITRWFSLCIVLFASVASGSIGPDPIADDWHGSLTIPTGELSIIVTIKSADDGTLSAQLESPDQAPGQKIPISEISLVDDHLHIVIAMIGAKIELDWDDDQQHFSGIFSQGAQLPITLSRGLPDKKPVIEGLDGTWNATVNRNGVDLRLILHINTTDTGTQISLDSPDMMTNGIQVTDLTRDGERVSYKIPVSSGSFVGTLIDEHTLEGTWTIPDQDDAIVTFVRTNTDPFAPVDRLRPQVPTKPYPYQSIDVEFDNPLAPGVTLAGTLTIPEGNGPFACAILLTGSGAQDRNETVFGHQPFLVLSDYLTRNGIAVLRYDDRGTAQSTGDFSQATSADFATDANAAFKFLMTRKEIASDAIGFVGHSEGGLVAPIAMKDNPGVAFLVMLAGPGTPSLQIVKSQNRLIALSQGASEEDIAQSESINSLITIAVAESTSSQDAEDKIRAIMTPQAREALGVDEAQLDMIVAQSTTPWTRYFLGYDPANFLPLIAQPILALNGELDLQVPAIENLEGIAKLTSTNPDVTIHKLDELNHMFQHSKTGAMGEYNDIEETFAPEAMDMIAQWINARFNRE